jgi:hypothetical protein
MPRVDQQPRSNVPSKERWNCLPDPAPVIKAVLPATEKGVDGSCMMD